MIVYWSPPGDTDLAGFRVLISRDDRDYYPIGQLATSVRHLVVDGSVLPSSVPFPFLNGTTYYLGVQSIDFAGNTSQLTETACW